MQTITCKVLPVTNTKPKRIKATACGGASVTVSCGYGDDKDYRRAALELMHKLNWFGEMIGGHTKDGMVFVFNDDEHKIGNFKNLGDVPSY